MYEWHADMLIRFINCYVVKFICRIPKLYYQNCIEVTLFNFPLNTGTLNISILCSTKPISCLISTHVHFTRTTVETPIVGVVTIVAILYRSRFTVRGAFSRRQRGS